MSNELSTTFLGLNIDELLPRTTEEHRVTFVACGPALLDALIEGKSIDDAARMARIAVSDAIKLLATPEFNRLKEAYLSLGDLESRSNRIRIAKSILAAQIAAGKVFGRKEPMDILEYVRREQDVKRGESQVHVQILNNIVPRPYRVVGEAILTSEASDDEVLPTVLTLPSNNNLRERMREKLNLVRD